MQGGGVGEAASATACVRCHDVALPHLHHQEVVVGLKVTVRRGGLHAPQHQLLRLLHTPCTRHRRTQFSGGTRHTAASCARHGTMRACIRRACVVLSDGCVSARVGSPTSDFTYSHLFVTVSSQGATHTHTFTQAAPPVQSRAHAPPPPTHTHTWICLMKPVAAVCSSCLSTCSRSLDSSAITKLAASRACTTRCRVAGAAGQQQHTAGACSCSAGTHPCAASNQCTVASGMLPRTPSQSPAAGGSGPGTCAASACPRSSTAAPDHRPTWAPLAALSSCRAGRAAAVPGRCFKLRHGACKLWIDAGHCAQPAADLALI
jgi:hypothetical protein